MTPYVTAKSKEMYEEAKRYLVDGVASSAHKYVKEEYPILISHAYGSKVFDVDGNEYIDYVAGYGPMILGYCNEDSDSMVIDQIHKGSQYAATTEIMYKLAKKLTEILPCAERISFQSTGTEADMHAFRLARAYTKKPKIVKFEGQYHGWSDEIKVSAYVDTSNDLGPKEHPNKIMGNKGQRRAASDDVLLCQWNDLDAMEKLLEREADQIAAVITEPIMTNNGPIFPQKGYLQGLRELTKKYKVLLIFDEVVTGFRLAFGGAQEYFGVTPDIATYAKAITSGYPLSVVAGRADIMECGVSSAGTFNGNPVAVAAALGVIKVLSKPGAYENLNQNNKSLVDGIHNLGKQYGIKLHCEGAGGLVALQFGIDRPLKDYRDCLDHVDVNAYDKFYFGTLKYGVRVMPSKGRIYISLAHTKEDIERTLEVIGEVFKTF